MRKVRVLEGLHGIIEDFGYFVGDAEDAARRERDHMHDLIDAVADGKLSAGGAKREVDVATANFLKQIDEARQLLGMGARRAGFTHVHPSLAEPSEDMPTLGQILAYRVVVPLPGGETA